VEDLGPIVKELFATLRSLRECPHLETIPIDPSPAGSRARMCRQCFACTAGGPDEAQAQTWTPHALAARLAEAGHETAQWLLALSSHLQEGARACAEVTLALESTAARARTDDDRVDPQWLEELAHIVQVIGRELETDAQGVETTAAWEPEHASGTIARDPESEERIKTA
jgi:hypothetical protein